MVLSDIILQDCFNSSNAPIACLAPGTAPSLKKLLSYRACKIVSLDTIDRNNGSEFLNDVQRILANERPTCFLYSGCTSRRLITRLLATLPYILAEEASILIDHADYPGVYEGIMEVLLPCPGYRFLELVLDREPNARPGQTIAVLRFDCNLKTPQPFSTIPPSKNKKLHSGFIASTPCHDINQMRRLASQSMERWKAQTYVSAKKTASIMKQEFPDQASPVTYWHDAVNQGFLDFFSWGHDHDFGFGFSRKGTMNDRHLEILAECLEYDYLPKDLTGWSILDVGCWTGGDALALAGLGADVIALEEHPVSANAATKLCELLNAPVMVIQQSLYKERRDWETRFDLIYLSGVIYHVTDPLLALRICFSYLKPNGRIIVETKSCHLDGAYCEYGGTLEKGWNWYAPSMETLGRWLTDAGFSESCIKLHTRPVGRLLAMAMKQGSLKLPEKAGFSRPQSWLEESA